MGVISRIFVCVSLTNILNLDGHGWFGCVIGTTKRVCESEDETNQQLAPLAKLMTLFFGRRRLLLLLLLLPLRPPTRATRNRNRKREKIVVCVGVCVYEELEWGSGIIYEGYDGI